jgi:hypothetical protein
MQLGDFVMADLVHAVGVVRGVFVRDNGDGTVEVQGQLDTGSAVLYQCKKEQALVIPDRNLRGRIVVFVVVVRDLYGFS